MTTLITILCSVMILMAIFLVIAVLMQSGKDNRLSGTIAGGADTFFGKTKGKSIDRVLSRATTIVAIIFVAMVFLVYVLQKAESKDKLGETNNSGTTQSQVETNVTEEETETEPLETATLDETGTTETGEGSEEATPGETEGETEGDNADNAAE